MSALWYVGDALTVLRTLPDASVDLVLTSPPFLALRAYLPADDPDKPLEMGSESAPGEFLDALLDVVVECRRVLAPHGSIAFELGDTYSGTNSTGEAALQGGNSMHAHQVAGTRVLTARPERRPGMAGWPLDKSLCLIPESFRFALAYGRNPHTGRTLEPWRVRNVIRWCRPNPPVGALADKFRPATSEMVIACTGRSRYFDLDSVRSGQQSEPGGSTQWHPHDGRDARGPEVLSGHTNTGSHPAGAPPLDWWRIPTQPYRGSHYATWPEDLCITPILAMCPQRVCTVCGKPSERITERERLVNGVAVSKDTKHKSASRQPPTGPASSAAGDPEWWEKYHDGAGGADLGVRVTTLGWSDCGHNAWRPGVVLDPFAGSGTTGAVAVGHGRSFIGVDLDERNAWLARERLGMFLEVVG